MTDEHALVAVLYDHVSAYRRAPDVGFFVAAAREAGSPVLEIGFGAVRVLIPTARAGIDIVGLDLSSSMLAECRRRLQDEPEAVQSRVELVQADMRNFDLGRTFTLATLPFRPFQHLLSVEDQLAALANIARHLRPGAKRILDVFNPSLDALANGPTGQMVAEGPEFSMPDGRQVTRHFGVESRDRFTQISQIELICDVTHPDGRTERRVHAFGMRHLFRFEAEHLLGRTGFEVVHLYSGYDKSAYGSVYPGDLIFVARKTGAAGCARSRDHDIASRLVLAPDQIRTTSEIRPKHFR